ncbi:MAG TPA: DUF4430 domain-containing protein [Pseudogracilibacillus sp.]|nr:DUF4430 domain-containing protein [Pseudogracilibacillus sp.]
MNKKLMKPFAFLFSFLLIFANLAFVQPSETFAKTLDKAVTISVLDADGGDIVGMQAVEFEEGDTALDVLEEVAEVDKEESSWGPMIIGINGEVPEWEDNESYWHVGVNGQASDVGADQIELNHADNILFLYKNKDHKEVQVDVTVDGHTEKVTLDPFSTAYDGLKQATNQLKVPLEVSIDAQLFAFINKLTDRELAENEFWSFMVNEQFAEVGISSYRVSEAEQLSFEVDSFEIEEDDGENSDTEKDNESDDVNDEESNDTEDNDKQNSDENKEANDEKEIEEETTEANPNIAAINQQVTNDLTVLKKEIENRGLLSGYGHEAYVWAYAKAGGKVPAEYRDNIAKALKEEDNFTNGYSYVNEIAKVVIALSAGGFDASNIGDTNLVEKLLDEDIPSQEAVATQAYALDAFDSGDYDVSETVKEEIVASIIEKQMTSGGWGFFGDTPSPDITGMVLNALAAYKSNDDVKVAIDKAVDYLADGYDGTGWYHDQWSGGYTSEAISQVIVGLSAADINPTEAPFVDEDGKALLSYLLEFKAADDLYKHVAEGDSDIGFTTSQAFLALAYYKDAFIEETEVPEQEETEEPKEETPSNDNEDNNDNNTKVEADKTTTTTDDPEVKVTKSTTKSEEVKDETLPKTNSNVFNILAIGLLSLAAGVVLVVLRRKWQSE